MPLLFASFTTATKQTEIAFLGADSPKPHRHIKAFSLRADRTSSSTGIRRFSHPPPLQKCSVLATAFDKVPEAALGPVAIEIDRDFIGAGFEKRKYTALSPGLAMRTIIASPFCMTTTFYRLWERSVEAPSPSRPAGNGHHGFASLSLTPGRSPFVNSTPAASRAALAAYGARLRSSPLLRSNQTASTNHSFVPLSASFNRRRRAVAFSQAL
jgi:hypothetical protein